jgi:3-deoxy-D-manno-octulosonic-acid transferase
VIVLALYRAGARLAAPVAPALLRRRLRRGKEDPSRVAERLGRAGRARPPGPLVWVHAASVGESLSVLPLIERCRARRPACTVLVTSGTVTSARLLAERLPEGALHQFAPLDLPDAVERFLDHWRPGLALWVESELWPTTLGALRGRRVPAVLVNARLSRRSFRRWSWARASARAMLGAFRAVFAQSRTDAQRFMRLGAPAVQDAGNLKAAAPPLPCDDRAFADLERATAGRAVWVAASTHDGEEAIVAHAHNRAAPHVPGLLTIVVPRHPERGADVARLMAGHGLATRRRGAGDGPDGAVYVADTLGELGLFYRLARVAFVGGSLIRHGGHNPLEPARLGRPVLFGPHMDNFADVARGLMEAGGGARVNDAEDLAGALVRLLLDPALAARWGGAAELAAHAGAGALDAAMAVIGPLIDALPDDARP